MDRMQRYRLNFAYRGNPNGADLPLWPAYDARQDHWLVLDHTIKVQPGVRKKKLDILEQTLVSKINALP